MTPLLFPAAYREMVQKTKNPPTRLSGGGLVGS
jgi:uncharacterized protein YjeT (DUF2065 family)